MRITFAQRTTSLALLLCLGLVPAALAQHDSDDSTTATPIKHVVVIFQENVSFDHYFGTYPHAAKNLDGTQYSPAPPTALRASTAWKAQACSPTTPTASIHSASTAASPTPAIRTTDTATNSSPSTAA